MRVLLSWLREFAPIEGEPTFIADQLSDLGLAVEELSAVGEGLDGVVVARVLECRPHPDADKVQLVDVDAGDGEAVQVVCGAFNMRPGDLVPLATVGATIKSGLTIERRKLRGQWSNGMLCAPDEIGLGADHSGILLLDAGLDVGLPLGEALGLGPDVLFDLEVNPNRPDALSVAGVARDLAARLGLPFSIPVPSVTETGAPAGESAAVEIISPDLCGHFLVRVIEQVSVAASPGWIAARLLALGMRPINSVVDVSNYVMLELGQPNHTYDLDLVPGGHLGARWAGDGEEIVTLDGVSRVLESTDGVIVDREDTPIGIAGVMGGASTEISESTRAVLLEMAWWNPMAIARTSTRLGLRSEASIRFERGADPEIASLAAARFCELVAAVGARIRPGEVDERGELPGRAPVTLRTARVNGLLGTALTTEQIRSHLEPIGFECRPAGEDLDVVIPGFRYDTTTETDVIEEVARHHGYENISKTVPTSVHIGGLTPRQRERREIRQILVGLGISETMPLPFLAPGDLERAGVSTEAVVLSNPLDANESVLRTSLRPGLLKAVAYNESHRQVGVRLFEMGKTFIRPAEGEPLPEEPEVLAVALAGAGAHEAVGVWRVLADSMALEGAELRPQAVGGLHPGRGAAIAVGEIDLGSVGEIDPAVAGSFGITGTVGWLEIDLDRLLDCPHDERVYRPVSRYPSSDIDLAVEVDDSVPASAVESVIRSEAGELLVSSELFDVYRGPQLGEGRRSLGYRLRLQAADRTLTEQDVAEVRERIVAGLAAGTGARLRLE